MGKISGIYCIENKLNDKKYIGQSQNCYRRIQTHITNLRKNRDTCLYLQRAWNLDGEENFIFYIIEECAFENLDEREIFYIKELKSHGSENGYNISYGGDAPMRGRKHSEQTIKHFKESRKGENHPNFGKPMSEGQKKKLSEGRKGEKHWNFGKKHSPKTIEKMKKNNKRAALGKNWTKDQKIERSKLYFGKNKSTKLDTNYKGVTFHKASQKWRARSSDHGKEIYLGLFETDIDAAKVYDNYMWDKFHNKELLNFPENFE